jgi:glycosyltransferase involved in cell wall biosynthesis
MAHALAALGQRVTIFNNCPQQEVINGVHYHPVDFAKEIEADIFIASTSGDGLDLGGIGEISLRARLKILMVHGLDPPLGIDLSEFDYIYALSNFVRGVIVDGWEVPGNKLFTTHRGVKEDHYHFPEELLPGRDPFGIVYASHPSKGLAPAIKILDILRKAEPRFSLHIYGGYRLWGEREKELDAAPDLTNHGLIGQRELACELGKYSYALHIQDRAEPFGISLIEAMRAGCVVLASSVGAFPEIIHSGYNGFIITGKSTEESTLQAAAKLILDLSKNEGERNRIRGNAVSSPHSWRTIAEAWNKHWDYALNEKSPTGPIRASAECPACNSDLLALPDGTHCIGCGLYQKTIIDE